MSRSKLFGLAISAAAFLGGDFDADPRRPPLPSPVVEFAGCASVRAVEGDTSDPACEIPADRTLQIWVEAPNGAELAVEVDGVARPATGVDVQGGRRIAVQVPESARRLIVRAGHFERRFSLLPNEDTPELREAESLRQVGKLDDAEELLRASLDDPRSSVRAQAMGKLARIERRRGAIDRAIVCFYEAIDGDRDAGRLSDEVFDGFVLALTLLYHDGDFTELRELCASLSPAAETFPLGRAMMLYLHGMLASAAGDLRAAGRSFAASAAIAERLLLDDHRIDVLQQQADVLLTLGRAAEALELLDRAGDLLSRRSRPCPRAQLLNNAGWTALIARESATLVRAAMPDPIPLLTESLALFRGPCLDPIAAGNALTSLAQAELDRGHASEARRYLEEARQAHAHPGDRFESWWLILEGRLALAAGRGDQGLRWYEALAALAARARLPGTTVTAELGRAQALDALGRVEDARRAYARADALLGRWSLLAPLGEGRDTFLAEHEASTRLRLDFLLRQAEAADDPRPWLEEAADTARRGRARILAAARWLDRLDGLSASERVRWEASLTAYRRGRAALVAQSGRDALLPADRFSAAASERRVEAAQIEGDFEQALATVGRSPVTAAALAAPEPGEVLLLYHPIRQGWAGLAVTSSRIVARRLDVVDPGATPEALSRRLLAPFRDVLDGAERIRFASCGALDGIDLHALPWNGRPLLASFPVVYSVDLPEHPRAPLPAGEPPRAVIVADPRGDLPAARREGRAVAASLERLGWIVDPLTGGRATHDAVREALERPGTRLFHYAGHGVFQGHDGWGSGLALADGALTLADVMALERAPSEVVLSGCETAKTGSTTAAGLGLAQAFAVAGATTVIAVVRPVDDRLAARIASDLYRSSPGALLGDLPDALRRAQLAAPAGTDWAAFRAFSP